MTKEEFDKIEFSALKKVVINGVECSLYSVDFRDREITVLTSDGRYSRVSYELLNVNQLNK